MTARGDRGEAWFTDVYAAHHAAVVRYGLRRLGDADAAGELAQEVFIVAWRRRADVPDRVLPWLYGVARRLLANHRRAARPVPIEHVEAAVGSDADLVATVTDLRSALSTLNDADQEILRLVGWEQLSVTEAAQVLECGRAAAAVRLHRARRRLLAALASPRRSAPPTSSAAVSPGGEFAC